MAPVLPSSAAFWSLMERWKLPDSVALDLIEFPGKLGKSGKRPRFRLNTKQARLVAYLLEVEGALAAIGHDHAWLRRPIRGAPFSGLSPLTSMVGGGEAAIADVLRHLARAGLKASLHAEHDEAPRAEHDEAPRAEHGEAPRAEHDQKPRAEHDRAPRAKGNQTRQDNATVTR
jgi:hypothetical protein